jgi:hypothetical protein
MSSVVIQDDEVIPHRGDGEDVQLPSFEMRKSSTQLSLGGTHRSFFPLEVKQPVLRYAGSSSRTIGSAPAGVADAKNDEASESRDIIRPCRAASAVPMEPRAFTFPSIVGPSLTMVRSGSVDDAVSSNKFSIPKRSYTEVQTSRYDASNQKERGRVQIGTPLINISMPMVAYNEYGELVKMSNLLKLRDPDFLTTTEILRLINKAYQQEVGC